MKSTRYNESLCPNCGERLDALTGTLHDRDPRDGDISVCLYCAAALRICLKDGELTLRIAEREDFEPLDLSVLLLVRLAQQQILRGKHERN